jgi:hypothetical protein
MKKPKQKRQDWIDKSTVVGIVRECLIVQPYSQDGEVIAIPVDEKVRSVAAQEAIAYIKESFRPYRR